MNTSPPRSWILFFAVLLVVFPCDVAAQLRFEPLVVVSNQVRLTLVGDPGQSYAIESSTDFSQWSVAFVGSAEDGKLELEADVDNLTNVFYRARLDAGIPEPFDITNSFETNFTIGTFATIDGLKRTLYAADGTAFVLQVPTNTVPESMPVTMTLVTNITGLPFSGPLLGAVRIEFDDEQLIGSATLTISFTNIDRRKVISFLTELDGSALTLTPDRVGKTNVMIPVTRAGIYGSVLGTTQEVATVLATINTNGVAVPSLQATEGEPDSILRMNSIIGTTRLCFPAAYNRAITVRNRIARLRRQIQAQLAAQLTISRQAQLAGAEEDSVEALAGAGATACEFYTQHIDPYWTEAANNCALMSILMQVAVPFDRQLQLLGVADSERCTANLFSPDRLCPAFRGCLQEIKICCSAGHPGRARMIDIVALSRQQALLGLDGYKSLGCWDLGDDKAEEAMDVCTPRSWSGSIKVKENGDFYELTLAANSFREVTRTHSLSYSGFIDEASEMNLGHLGVQATLKFDGNLIVREFSEDKTVFGSTCGTGVHSFTSDAGVSDGGYYVMNINVQTNGSYGLALGFVGKNKDGEPVQGTELTVTLGTSPAGIGCDPPLRQTMDSDVDHQIFSSPGTFFNGPGTGSMNRIQGKQTFPGLGSSPETTVEIEWNLTRRIRQ